MTTPTLTMQTHERPQEQLAREFLDALVARDFERVQSLLAPGAGMRALTPRKVIEEAGAQAIVERFAAWYEQADRIHLIESLVSCIAERGALTYRMRKWDTDGASDVMQHLFLDTREGRIHRIDLVCSGFQPAALQAVA